MAVVTIRDIRAFCIKPAGFNLVVVKLETSEPGLYGLGCATFPYHFNAVKSVIEEYYKPLLLGRDVSRIEEIWNMLHAASYWRTGPITNNAIAGVDIALWDIKGKMANMPIHDLLGGKSRTAVPVYRYAQSEQLDAVVEQALALKESGAQYIRIQWNNYNTPEIRRLAPEKALDGYYFDPQKYCSDTVKLFKTLRRALGDNVELCHDVHERVSPSQALWLAKALEPYRPYFLEDIFSPEQVGWFRQIRPQTNMPLAMGELFTNPVEWEDLIKERLIDFIRVHVSQIGGITAAKKIAAFAEQFGIRTAWHGSPDMSPIGHAVNVQLDMTMTNFGIQEWSELNNLLYEMFPGAPVIKGAYACMDDKPGIGVEFDEALAKKYPAEICKTDWLEMRRPDGSMQLP